MLLIDCRIKCARCTKYLGHTSYSARQLNDARFAVKLKGHNATYNVKCRRCVGAPPVEVACAMCGKVKGLEEFAKVQRSRQDISRCMDCTDDLLERAPVETENYEDPRAAYTAADHSNGNYPDYWGGSTDAAASESASF